MRYVIAFVMVLSCVSTYLLLHLAHCVYSRNLDHQCIVGCAVVVVSIYKGASSPFSLEKHAIGHTSHIMHLIQVVMVGVVSESNFE